jgi:transposase
MDVHRKRSQIALVDESGAQLANRNLPNDPAELKALLGRLAPGTPVAFEAAYGWGWLADLLDELGLEPYLVHPTRCKAIASAGLKDDKVDARTLAHLLRTDLLPEAWIAPQAVRDQRALLRHRVALVQVATSLRNRVHAMLADRGIRLEQRLGAERGARVRYGPCGLVSVVPVEEQVRQRLIAVGTRAVVEPGVVVEPGAIRDHGVEVGAVGLLQHSLVGVASVRALILERHGRLYDAQPGFAGSVDSVARAFSSPWNGRRL